MKLAILSTQLLAFLIVPIKIFASTCGSCPSREAVSVLFYDAGIANPDNYDSALYRKFVVPSLDASIKQAEKYHFQGKDERTKSTKILKPIPVNNVTELSKKMIELASPPTCFEIKYLGILAHGGGGSTETTNGGRSYFLSNSKGDSKKVQKLDMSNISKLKEASCAMASSADVDLLSCFGFKGCQGENLAIGIADQLLSNGGGKIRGFRSGAGGYWSMPLYGDKRLAIDLDKNPTSLANVFHVTDGYEPHLPKGEELILKIYPKGSQENFEWSKSPSDPIECQNQLLKEIDDLKIKGKQSTGFDPSVNFVGGNLKVCKDLDFELKKLNGEIVTLKRQTDTENIFLGELPKVRSWKQVNEDFYTKAVNFDRNRTALAELQSKSDSLGDELIKKTNGKYKSCYVGKYKEHNDSTSQPAHK